MGQGRGRREESLEPLLGWRIGEREEKVSVCH